MDTLFNFIQGNINSRYQLYVCLRKFYLEGKASSDKAILIAHICPEWTGFLHDEIISLALDIWLKLMTTLPLTHLVSESRCRHPNHYMEGTVPSR